ncbi:MAG TPA: YkgJ family cysteine cluster protein [Polyangiaceae bacterium]|nr:YkgJ family cysteine cluster protein [Polyangiaceae bacterium]
MGSNKKQCLADEDNPKQKEKPAGGFSSWLRDTQRAMQQKTVGADVPCGDCTGCCRSSLFIHIKPEETRTLKRIPRALQFPAPGLPKGNMLMGYNTKGECPMLLDNKCSIYEDRPQTCRDYDCRVFAATGIALDQTPPRLIAEQIERWRFEYPSEQDRKDYSAVQAAAAFLHGHSDCFPPGALPSNPTHLALLAIRVHDVFSKLLGASRTEQSPSDAEIAKAVLEEMEKLRIGSERRRRGSNPRLTQAPLQLAGRASDQGHGRRPRHSG